MKDDLDKKTSILTSDDSGNGPNSHLFDYLNYYKNLDRPGFGVLITGEWGVGKTYLVKHLLPWEDKDKQSYYVSLFGLKNADEVNAAVYAEMFPVWAKANKFIEKTGDATKGFSLNGYNLGSIGSLGANLISSLLKQDIDTTKPIIFDDLERSSMNDPKEIIGTINYYVEKKACRVIVIAHDEKLVSEIKDTKEKIFGQTIHIEPDTDSAFTKFNKELVDLQSANKINEFRTEIIGVFEQSGSKSLRVLRQSMFDLHRFLENLEKRHIDNKSGMSKIVSLFMAFDMAIRTNYLKAPEIQEKQDSGSLFPVRYSLPSNQFLNNNTPTNISLKNQFSKVDLNDQALNDNVLFEMMVRGRYDKNKICASLDNSNYFASADHLPPWRKLMGFSDFPDAIVEEAKNKLEEQFKERIVNNIGEMLHIFALRYMMANKGILDCSVKCVNDDNKAYIDDLLKTGRLPLPFEDQSNNHWSFQGSHNYQYWIEEDYEALFSDLLKYLETQQMTALKKNYPIIREELLNLLSQEPQKFATSISFNSNSEHKYARLPVMEAIAVQDFVQTWLSVPDTVRSDVWHWTKNGLERRYDGFELYPGKGKLSSEREWIKSVLESMKTYAASEIGFRKLRMERAIPKIDIPEA